MSVRSGTWGASVAGSAGYCLVNLTGGGCSVRSLENGETFHPVVGPAVEAEALHLRQMRLRERAAASPDGFVVWDVGLGAAANAVTVLRGLAGIRTCLHLISFDRTLDALRFALAQRDQLPYLKDFERDLEALVDTTPQVIDLRRGELTGTWEVQLGDFPSMVRDGFGERGGLRPPHAILYDPFSPARNPEMWTLPHFRALHGRLDPDRPCALATYSRSTLLRVTLLLAGFYVGVGEATGEKEETTLAANTPALIARLLDLAWLGRACRSTSAEPLIDPVYRQRSLTEATRRELLRHPQFG